jgi:Histidine kinase-, DNA gyrase B-, and HSP90-like ATPase
MPALRGVGYSLDTAIADLIDNSIAAGARTISITPRFADGAASLAILDDGRGMTPDVMLEALRFGGAGPKAPRRESDLGRFGLGLKTASLSQARRLTLCSKSAGAVHAMRWDLDHVMQGDGRWEVLEGFAIGSEHYAAQLDQLPSGTLVLWELVDFGRDREQVDEAVFRSELASLAAHLGMVFHRFIERGALRIRLGAMDVSAWDPFLETQKPSSTEVGADRIRTAAGDVLVAGFVMPHRDRFSNDREFERAGGPDGWHAHQGFHIYRGDRIVVSGGWLRLGHGKAWRRSETSRLARIRVEIPTSADFEWQIDVKKSVARPPASVRPRLERLAKDVRERAREIYLHRAAKSGGVREGRRPLWLLGHADGSPQYRIDRDHPAVAAAGSGDLQALADLLALIEKTVPIETTLPDQQENSAASLPVVDTDLLRIAIGLVRRRLATGETRSNALQVVAEAEPFNTIPDISRLIHDACGDDENGES